MIKIPDVQTENKREYYPLRFRLDSVQRYLLWFSTNQWDDTEWRPDMVFVDASGKSPYFKNIESLEAFCKEQEISLIDGGEPVLFNLDVVACWLKSKKRTRARHVESVAFLNAWSMFDDVSISVGKNLGLYQGLNLRIYEKLFAANNFPSITPEGHFYIPLWTGAELRQMHDTLSLGLHLFRNSIYKS